MNSRILLIGSLVFVSNVVFAQGIIVLPQATETVAQLSLSFEKEVSNALVNRGIEVETAKELSKNSVMDAQSAACLTQIASDTLSLTSENIYNYIASQALYKKRVDLRNYSDVLALVQNVHGLVLEKEKQDAISLYMLRIKNS